MRRVLRVEGSSRLACGSYVGSQVTFAMPPSEWSIDYESLGQGRDDECRAESSSLRNLLAKLREVEIVLARVERCVPARCGQRADLLPVEQGVWRPKMDQARGMKDLEKEEPAATRRDLGPDVGQADPAGGRPGETSSSRLNALSAG